MLRTIDMTGLRRAGVAVAGFLLMATASPHADSSAIASTPHEHWACVPHAMTHAPVGYEARDLNTPARPLFVRRDISGDVAPARRGIHVDVYVHVLRTARRGGVPHPRIVRQITVLNRAYAGRESAQSAASPFSFSLTSVDVTRKRTWYRMTEGSLAERHAKRALHQGDAEDLNVYVGSNASGVLGWGSSPGRVAHQPLMDGVVIARHTMPGGRGGRYSAGDTLVHETGHWLGLFHTYAGGCSAPGDRVADTPREGRPAYECPRRRNTCRAPGTDPVHNFMDAGTDTCMNRFTNGQISRMTAAWNVLRAG